MEDSRNISPDQSALGRLIPSKGVLIAIGLAVAGVLITGLITVGPMIGDEVTHYYMMKTQAEVLPAANVIARIPYAYEDVEVRYYPHVFLWHYIGALFSLPFGVSPLIVQVYQALFALQFLVFAALLAWMSEREHPGSALIYILLLASLPMCLLLSVAFYQDVPAAAQVLTGCFLLKRGKVGLGAFFMGLAAAIKISAFALIPAFVLCAGWVPGPVSAWKRVRRIALSAAVILLLCWTMAIALASVHVEYYPLTVLKQHVSISGIDRWLTTPGDQSPHRLATAVNLAPKRPEVAVHPGDLRRPINYLIYGGGLMWPAALIGLSLLAAAPLRREKRPAADLWALAAGVWFIGVTAITMRNAPDARFFLIGVVLILLPVAQAVSRVPYRRLWMPLLVAGSLLQGAGVLWKTHELRRIPDGVKEAIIYLKDNPPEPNCVFMYPEGSYRLFPCKINWYLEYQLRDLWKADQNGRIQMLRRKGIGAIVIKKHLIGQIDPGMKNLGIYPDFFVRDTENDKRYTKVMDNKDVTIYLLPEEKTDQWKTSEAQE